MDTNTGTQDQGVKKDEERMVPYSMYEASVVAAIDEARNARTRLWETEADSYKKGYIRGCLWTALWITIGNILWIVLKAL